ncbi:MAG: hypothetical protein KGH72_01620 [Candidatus Micrarchaeota archaeon]|nr:hypothetical protein [Candidatus Micrarchaeota archaeon]
MPDAEANARAMGEIRRLASAYGTVPFEPHVTIVDSARGEETYLINKTIEFARRIRPLRLDFSGLDQTDQYFRCVFARIRETRELIDCHSLGADIFKVQKNGFMPHMSLMYGNMPAGKRAEIISGIEKDGLLDKLRGSGFGVDRLSLNIVGADMGRWKTLKVLNLQG